jgi:hypothetical protein
MASRDWKGLNSRLLLVTASRSELLNIKAKHAGNYKSYKLSASLLSGNT